MISRAIPAEAARPRISFRWMVGRLSRSNGVKVRLPRHVVSFARIDVARLMLSAATIRSVEIIEADNGGKACRSAAHVVEAPAALAAEMAERLQTPIAPPTSRIALVSHASVRDGIVETADGTILSESLINRTAGDPLPVDRWRVARRLRNRRYVLLKQRWDANYGHWLFEGLPRLSLVADHFDLAGLGFIVSGHHGPMQRVYEDSLALFGISREQIVEVGDEPVAVDHLIYPTPMTRHPWHIAPRCMAMLEELAARVRVDPGRAERLYVTRNRAARRRLLNEAELIDIVHRRGFTVVAPETLCLYRQIGLFRNARIVVGNQGAALTNVAFAAGSPTLFAVTSPAMKDDFFSTLMSLKRGRFVSLHGQTAEPRADMNADFRIDPSRFRTMLDALL